MKSKQSNNGWVTKYTFIPPIIIIMVLCVIFKVKGLYPFGGNTICYADFIQCYVINYKYFIDIFRNFNFSKLFFTDTLYGGTGIFGTMSVTGIFSIFSIIYLLCPNSEDLIFFMSYVFAIKAALASVTMYYSIKRLFSKNNELINVVLSVLWGLSSYILLNYTTIIWLDVMILFPVFIVAFKNLIDGKSITMYVVTLALLVITSFQLSYMILFFVIIAMASAIFLYIKKENRKKAVVKLGFATVLGLLISSVVFLPTLRIYLSSHRNSLSGAILSYDGVILIKLLHLILYSLPCYGLIASLKYVKKDNNIKIILISVLFTGIIPAVLEGCNLIWHGGGYFCFPFRQGFIPFYLMLILVGYYFNNYYEKENLFKTNYIKIISIIVSIILLVLSVVLNYLFVAESCEIRLVYQGITGLTIIFAFGYCVSRIVAYILLAKVNKTIAKVTIITIALVEILLSCFSMIGLLGTNVKDLNKYYNELKISNQVKEIISNLPSDVKFLDYDGDFYENGGLYTDLYLNSGWILFDHNTSKLHDYFYCDDDHTKINSRNGNILSDYLFNVGYVISKENLDSRLFTKVADLEVGKKLYKYNYDVNHAFKYSSNYDISKLSDNDTLKNTYDTVFGALTNNKYSFIETLEGKSLPVDDVIGGKVIVTPLEFDIEISGNKIICYDYFHRAKVVSIEISKLDDNNNVLNTKTIYTNRELKTDLGMYKDEHLKIKLNVFTYTSSVEDAQIEIIDVDKFLEYVNSNEMDKVNFEKENNKYKYFVNGNENEKLLIPINYSKNWIITNNGDRIKYDKALDGFISVDLKNGNNNIELKYFDPWIIYGAVITILSIVLLVVYNKNESKIINNKKIQAISNFGFLVLTLVLISFMTGYGIGLTILDYVNSVF